MKKNGFTLIELLVVIAIIAILAAILFPVFVSAKESAKQSSCVSNLKQCASAVNLYVGDNGDKPPPMYFSQTANAWQQPLSRENLENSLINRYMKNIKIQLCPSAPVSQVCPKAPSYGMNAAFFGMPSARYFYAGGPGIDDRYVPPSIRALQKPPVLGIIRSPSRTIMLMDMFPAISYIFPTTDTGVPGGERKVWQWLGRGADSWGPPWGGKVTGVDSGFHKNGTNFAFADGHVKWHKVYTQQIDDGSWWDLN